MESFVLIELMLYLCRMIQIINILPNIISYISHKKAKKITDFIRDEILKIIIDKGKENEYRLGISMFNNMDCEYHFSLLDFKIIPIFEGNWFFTRLVGFKLIEYSGDYRIFDVLSGTQIPSKTVKIVFQKTNIADISEYIKSNI